MTWFKKRPKTVGDHEAFINLVQVAGEDEEIRKRLTAILEQEPFHRKSLLNTWINDMKMRQAPADFVAAIAMLLDDQVAEKLMEVLRK
ncbi:MAG: hypothetical protein AB1641_22570 [Thermodesulfobacteriota bacterium]